MKKIALIVTAICCNCGGLDSESPSSTHNKNVCIVNLSYDYLQVSYDHDLPRYSAKEYSDSCKDYLGSNIQTLRYRLNIQTKESVGIVEQISIDGRKIALASYSLDDQNLAIDNVDTSEIDNGPLQMESIWVSFAFPKNTEKSLYPTKVQLVISPRG